MQDSPVGVRDTDYNSVFSSGQSVAATFDRGLLYARGYAMGSEHKGKGVTVQLGPVAGPLGRSPEGGVCNFRSNSFPLAAEFASFESRYCFKERVFRVKTCLAARAKSTRLLVSALMSNC
jgi:hypothetical protein